MNIRKKHKQKMKTVYLNIKKTFFGWTVSDEYIDKIRIKVEGILIGLQKVF